MQKAASLVFVCHEKGLRYELGTISPKDPALSFSKASTSGAWSQTREPGMNRKVVARTLNRFVIVLVSVLSMVGCVNLSRTLEPEPIFPAPSASVNVAELPLSWTALLLLMSSQSSGTWAVYLVSKSDRW